MASASSTVQAAVLHGSFVSHCVSSRGVLRRYHAQLERLLEDRPDFVQPAKRRNEVLGWIRSGAQDFSLSRAKVDWGIRVPWDPSQTIYVWTDALHGYLSGK